MSREGGVADLREALLKLGISSAPTPQQGALIRRFLAQCESGDPASLTHEQLSALALAAREVSPRERKMASGAFVSTKRSRDASGHSEAMPLSPLSRTQNAHQILQQHQRELQGKSQDSDHLPSHFHSNQQHVHQNQQQNLSQRSQNQNQLQLQQHQDHLQQDMDQGHNHLQHQTQYRFESGCCADGSGQTMSFRKRRRQAMVPRSAEEVREASFDLYKDHGGSGSIGTDGMLRLCNDLGVHPEDPVMIVLSWALKARELGVYTRTEFLAGLEVLQVRTVEEIRTSGRLEELRALLEIDHPEFPSVYRFAYGWACDPGQRCLHKDVALSLWPIILQRARCDLLGDFLAYIGSLDSVRGISRDLWVQTLHLIKMRMQTGDAFFEAFDSETGAWPLAIDDFVLMLQSKRKNLSMSDT
mmetsp:Transcript_1012/g.2445  ORF Transcript_1012/g.2445 Transcript_1012/m.2445 type:complete len:415 (+) Transcript_1012:120-1364(+)